MLTDYEETKTTGTQMTLIAIGVISTLFKLKPSTIKELHKSCKLKIYDCNERIILSAIAFLTLPETVEELHKRLPAVTMPRLPSKPKLTYLTRRKDICPYKEELFKRPDWAGYRNALQKWQKHSKLIAIPKVILPLNKCGQFFIDDRSDVKKRRKGTSTEHLKKIDTKELQKISLTMYDHQKDSSRERTLESILEPANDSKKSNFRSLSKKPETVENKIYGPPKPPGAGIKSWLRKKDVHYMIAGVSTENSHDYPITYEIAGVINVTPSNSDEEFFAMLKLGDHTKKIFPCGRENLSINWQMWLQNVDESYKQLEEEADELIKNVQTTIKLVLPAPFCDSCCACRQTKKFEEQQSKISKALIDGEKNIHIANSMAMQFSEQNPIELPINQVPEDEITTNIIHPIKNVPPCSCSSIQQMTHKDISLSINKESIPCSKEGLCPGMKYRPKQSDAYSCKMYPGDKFYKYNPFMKEIIKMERKKIEIKINKTDYETTLKLTSPEWPTTSLPLKMQERQNDIFSKNLKKIKNDTLAKKINTKTSLKSLKKFQKGMSNGKKEIKNIKNQKIEPISLKKFTFNKKDTKLLNTISGSIATSEMKKKKQQTKSSLRNNPIKQSNKISKLNKHSFVKKNGKKNIDEAEKIKNRKREMARLKNMFKPFAGVLGNIQPAVLPEELLAISQRISEKKTEKIDFSATDDEEEIRRTKKEPCGWRTKSEQELPAKKTVAYLCEPDYPLETMAVRPGGRPCQCRENRNKKKILTHNISGLVENKRDERRANRKKLKEENRIIDGVLYVTPPISPRRSDEYVPEYDLFKSPYDMCVSEAMDEKLKLIEKYSGPKNLVEKIRKKPKSCNCCNNIVKEGHLIEQKKDLEETRKKFMESKLPEERWKIALKDTALTDYFMQRDNNIPCWTTCKKIARSYRPRRLKVVKPVCECKYERKIVERNEERMKWKTHDIFMSPPLKIIDGLKMSTPFQTPSSSAEDILQTDVLHPHWSPMNIPSNPLPRKDAALKEEMEEVSREKVRDDALKFIYGDKNEQDISYLTTHNYQDELIKKVDKRIDNTKESIKKETSKVIAKLQSLNEETRSKIGHRRDVPHKETTGKIIHENKYSEEIIEVDQQNVSHKQIEKTKEKIDDKSHRIRGGGDKKYVNEFDQLIAIMKVELKKMAAEGYIFAKLPKCYLMPQLQDWVMYRQGVVFSETDKKNLMQETRIMWNITTKKMPMQIEKPSLHMTKPQLKRLTFDQAERFKKKIEKIKEVYHNEVRKTRVSHARLMWSTMEHGKFPSASFKRTFFTYLASKEADGHVYKPWLPSELRKEDLNFCCP
ncbi:hypothetical protein ALC53_12106 [Atta colombica]|uniref:DUF4771 domain-containing protein n=1 Tax=Atta colombica TaxID=520822 RepID=A0A195AZL0_9HYME|nr:hypothetical protein ALC53_12106 [Atta colombica]